MAPDVGWKSECLDFDRAVNLVPGVLARVVDSDRLSGRRMSGVKIAFLARHIPAVAMQRLLRGLMRPRSGDLVLVRVDSIGDAPAELMSGKGDIVRLRKDMEAVLVYGRGWGDIHQLAMIPPSMERTQLIAKCGLASTIAAGHLADDLPWVQPLGLIADVAGRPLNLADFCVATAQDN